MSTQKGRQIVKDAQGKGIFIDTVPKKSAQQGILVNQDAIVTQLNAILAAVQTCATSLAAASAVSDVAAAGTALQTAIGSLQALNEVVLK